MPVNFLQKKIYALQDYITSRLLKIHPLPDFKVFNLSNKKVFAELELFCEHLGILYRSNKISKFLEEDEFTNAIISEEHIDPIFMFLNWTSENEDNYFTICSYPFLLDVAFKIAIIFIESRVEMKHERTQALQFTNIWQLLQDPLKKMFFYLKVHRENIIKETMDQLEQNKKNSKKELKVLFVNFVQFIFPRFPL